MAERFILHVDMDAFFVSVELLDQPELRGRPVVVGGTGDRGVVAAASYEARSYGVFSAMPSVQAKRLCPHAVFLSGRYDRYVEVSGRVMDIFSAFTPLVEPLSLDEAFLDVTGSRRLHGTAPAIGAEIRRRVLADVGLTCSVGVAPTKFVAKLASEAAKPKASPAGPVFGSGIVVVTPELLIGFLHALPVKALWGVGPATLAKLNRLGVGSVGDLAQLPVATVEAAVGKAQGRHLHNLATGIDARPVLSSRDAKSIGHEETFRHDIVNPAELDRELVRMADAVASRVRAAGVGGRTLTLKVRYPDFRTITRSITRPQPIDDAHEMVLLGRGLLAELDLSGGVRLLGVHMSGLRQGGPQQGQLSFATTDEVGRGQAWHDANTAIDQIRAKFGDTAIGPAVLVDEGGLRRKVRGDQQWGPTLAAETVETNRSEEIER